jgi:hypothetical protein
MIAQVATLVSVPRNDERPVGVIARKQRNLARALQRNDNVSNKIEHLCHVLSHGSGLKAPQCAQALDFSGRRG